MENVSTLDIVLIIILLIGVIRGVARGLSGELSSVIGLVVAGATGWYLHEPLGSYIAERTEWTATQADTAAWLSILLLALIVLWVVSAFLRSIMAFTFKGALERVGGALVGGLRYATLVAIGLLVIVQFSDGKAYRAVTEDSVISRNALDVLMPYYEELLQRFPDFPAPAEPAVEEEPYDDYYYPY